jgi:hypothetical protein
MTARVNMAFSRPQNYDSLQRMSLLTERQEASVTIRFATTCGKPISSSSGTIASSTTAVGAGLDATGSGATVTIRATVRSSEGVSGGGTPLVFAVQISR